MRVIGATLMLLAAGALAACSGGEGSADPPADPGGAVDEPTASEPAAEDPCIVGTWNLDVADYEAQSAQFLADVGVPIEDFAMSGAGKITFTPDGLVATDIELLSTGTIVAGDVQVPVSVPSAYTGSGDWSPGTEGTTIDLANWANVPSSDEPVYPAAPPVPAIDYTDIPELSAQCTADTLVLQAPEAPLAAMWHR